jgi:ribose 5-phosphate isomerase A
VCRRLLAGLGWQAELRMAGGGAFVTDAGNPILDCTRRDWSDPDALAADLDSIPGLVEHGLFLGIARAAYVASSEGARTLLA